MSDTKIVRTIAFKGVLVAVLASMFFFTTTATTAVAAQKTHQVKIRYVPPKNPELQPVYEAVKQRHSLEKLQNFLSPFRLPEKLRISFDDCDGEPDAFYENNAITICYEYVDELWKNMPEETTPSGIAPSDTVIGPLFEVALHELGHALFEMLELPVLGREEDAADQVAAYILLQFGESEAQRLIKGTVYAYRIEAEETDPCRPLNVYADEHGTPAQRAYNALCMAYGADNKVFEEVVSGGYLPRERAEFCDEEYEQVQDAFEMLILPHIDVDLVEEIRGGSWLCTGENDDPSKKCSMFDPEK